MKKLLFPLVTLTVFAFMTLAPSYALTTELTSESETEKIYTVFSSAPQDSSAMKLRISVSGGTIKNVENADPDHLTFMPVCSNGSSFQDQNVCIDVAVVGNIFQENHEVLRVVVEPESDQEVVFSPGEDHAYLTINNEIVRENGEVVQTAPTVLQTQEPAPVMEEATVNDTNYLPFILLIGILVVLVGAFLAVIFLSDKDSAK